MTNAVQFPGRVELKNNGVPGRPSNYAAEIPEVLLALFEGAGLKPCSTGPVQCYSSRNFQPAAQGTQIGLRHTKDGFRIYASRKRGENRFSNSWGADADGLRAALEFLGSETVSEENASSRRNVLDAKQTYKLGRLLEELVDVDDEGFSFFADGSTDRGVVERLKEALGFQLTEYNVISLREKIFGPTRPTIKIDPVSEIEKLHARVDELELQLKDLESSLRKILYEANIFVEEEIKRMKNAIVAVSTGKKVTFE